MDRTDELDQFELLERKVESLLGYIASFQKEKDALQEKIHIQDERIADLGSELEALRASRDKAKQRIIGLLERIEQVGM
ncbi:MAG: cell division protein ZapB [Deltaproteobacteria bacterium]|nr:cell division protein ZapB [Deltaproteobacteria bacterium]